MVLYMKSAKTNTVAKQDKGNKKVNIKNVLGYITLFLFPIAIFYMFELYTHNPWETIKVPIQFLNIFFYEIFTIFLFCLIGKMKIALYIETIFFAVIGLANYYVIDFRSAPIMPWDLLSVKTAASVANNYKYTVKKETVFVVLGFILLLLIEIFFFKYFDSKLKLKFTKKSRYIRVMGLLISFLLLYGFTGMLHKEETVKRFKMYDKLFTPTVMSKRNGTTVAFLMELQYITVTKPEGYTKANASQLLASYAIPENEKAEVSTTPNIIVIMNEAFSDPAILGDFSTNEDYMPFVHDMLDQRINNAVSGNLNVSVLGGNTANTEFEFLTGNTMAFLPQGSVAYQQYVKHDLPSLASHLKSLGYDTIAMHPYNSTGWNRNTVYPMLGFDTSYFIRDWDNPEKIRKYVSDQACYDKIISLYEEKDENHPFFVFNVTMQNHSSYSEDFDNFKPDITVDGINSKSLTNYLSLLKRSDSAIQNLVDYFSNQEEPTIIVFFGDHQPTNSVVNPILKLNGKSTENLSPEDEAARYKVPFFIWANYDITNESDVEISANFLSTKLLETAGLPLYDYTNYLKDLQTDFKVITSIQALDIADNSTPVKEVNKQINAYAQLQYYQLFGKK